MKSKIDFNAFDKNNKKVADLDMNTVKSKAKAGCKKLAGKEGLKTKFHLILDYFVDDKGKKLGHFLDFGLNKKMTKHFEQIEMKSGKLDKSMSENPKKASAGEAYVKIVDGKKKIHIEPLPSSKVPKGQWPKILKSLRPLLNGMKAVVVLDGELIEDGKDADDGDKAKGKDKETAPKQEDKKEPSVAEKVKSLFSEITDGLKNKLPQVVPNVKKKNVSQSDMDITGALWDKIEELKELYENAEESVKNKMTKGYSAVMKQAPKVEKIQKAVESLLGISDKDEKAENTAGEETSEEANELKELLDYMKKEIDDFDKAFSKLKEDISNTDSEAIAGGDDLLKAIF